MTFTQDVTQIPQKRYSDDINTTDKRFPRTLAEAFPHHYREQYIPIVIHRPQRVNPDYVVTATCLFALGFLVGLAVGVS